MTNRFHAVLGLAVAIVAPSALAQAEKVNLRSKFHAGQNLRYEIKTDFTRAVSSSKGAGQQQNSTQHIVFGLNVLEASDAATSATLTYEVINISLATPKGTSSFDSATKPEDNAANQLEPVLRPLVNAPLKVTWDADGKITGIEGAENLVPLSPMKDMANAFITPSGAQQLLGGVLGMHAPAEGVSVGGTWTGEDITDLAQLGKYARASLFTLKGVDAGTATIEVSGNVEREVSGKQTPFTISDSSFNSTILWDVAGTSVSKLTRDLELTLTSEMQGAKADIKQSTRMTLTRLDGPAATPEAKPVGQAAGAGTTTASE